MSRVSFLNDLKNYWPIVTAIVAVIVALSGNIVKTERLEDRMNSAPPEVIMSEVKHLQKDVDDLGDGQEEIKKDIKTLLSRK